MFPSLAYLIIQAVAGLLTDAFAQVHRCQLSAGIFLGQQFDDQARWGKAIFGLVVRIGDPFADLSKKQLNLQESPWLGLLPVFGLCRRAATCRYFFSGDRSWVEARSCFAQSTSPGVFNISVSTGRWELANCSDFFSPFRLNRWQPIR